MRTLSFKKLLQREKNEGVLERKKTRKMSIWRMQWLVGFIFMHCWLVVKSELHYHDLFLEEANFTKLCSTKSMLTANGSFPGPTIEVHKGDTIYVNVYNQGNYGVTVHWHGIRQPRNPWSDGPENVTQCPIQPGMNYTYEVILSSEEGTLWWHAHSDWSRATVHGALIILPALGTTYPFPTPYSEDTIIIASWYKGDLKAIFDEAMTSGSTFNLSDAYTLNGEPGDFYSCSNETTYRLSVEYNKTYMLRIINGVINEEQFFGIANHSLTVVGHDGAYVKPVTVDYIFITPGQTFDVLITANQTPSEYYIASTPFFDSSVSFDNSTTTGILEYSGNYTVPSAISYPEFPSYDNEDAAVNFTGILRSLASDEHPVNVPQNVTQTMLITIAVNLYPCGDNKTCDGPDGDRNAASLNNVSFEAQDVDILTAYYRNLSGIYDDDFPSYPLDYFNFTGNVDNISDYTTKRTTVKMLDYGDAVEIVFQGTSIRVAENHPIHLHGFSYYLVGIGSGNFDNETDPSSYNLVDPPEVNTVGVPRDGWVAIRFFADNPGVWFVHCHLERHLSWGMDMVLIVRNGNSTATSMKKPPAYMPPCLPSSTTSVLQLEEFIAPQILL